MNIAAVALECDPPDRVWAHRPNSHWHNRLSKKSFFIILLQWWHILCVVSWVFHTAGCAPLTGAWQWSKHGYALRAVSLRDDWWQHLLWTMITFFDLLWLTMILHECRWFSIDPQENAFGDHAFGFRMLFLTCLYRFFQDLFNVMYVTVIIDLTIHQKIIYYNWNYLAQSIYFSFETIINTLWKNSLKNSLQQKSHLYSLIYLQIIYVCYILNINWYF